jgi:hypothetical protein
VGAYKRFPSPDRPIPAPRDKATGLGSTDSEQVPAERGRMVEQPHAFTGIRSRSRFAPEDKPPSIGHGQAVAVIPLETLPEPNLDSQFSSQVPQARTELPARAERGASLGQETPFLQRIAALIFVRRSDPGGASSPGPALGGRGGGITRASDLIRWSDFGVVPGRIGRRYTLRREFMQGAQTFLGIRGYQARRSNASTAPVSMLPPRVSRLTERSLPGSFGKQTEVVNG